MPYAVYFIHPLPVVLSAKCPSGSSGLLSQIIDKEGLSKPLLLYSSRVGNDIWTPRRPTDMDAH